MKVAAVQFKPTFKDHLGNLTKASMLAVQAAKAGARVVVLPELCTAGYSFMNAAEALPLAEVLTEFKPELIGNMPPKGDCPCPSMYAMFLIARETGAYIVWGLVEKDAGTGDLYNAQVCMAPDGFWVSMQKINRWGNDFLWAKPGRSNPPVVEMRLSGKKPDEPPSPMDKFATYKLGMLICRDIRDKKDDKWTDFYEKGDADIVAFSANWGNGGFPATSWMDFAKDNDSILIVSNRYGEEVNNDFGHGGVCVIWPDGRVACDGLLWDQDCIVYAEV